MPEISHAPRPARPHRPARLPARLGAFRPGLGEGCSGSATSARSARAISARPTCCAPATSSRRLLTLVGDVGKGAFAVLVARALLGEDAAQLAGLARLSRPSLPGLHRLQGRQGRGDLARHAAGPGLAGRACRRRHLARRRGAVPDLVARGARPPPRSRPVWALAARAGRRLWCWRSCSAALIFQRHHQNIGRLLKGEEPKIGKK